MTDRPVARHCVSCVGGPAKGTLSGSGTTSEAAFDVALHRLACVDSLCRRPRSTDSRGPGTYMVRTLHIAAGTKPKLEPSGWHNIDAPKPEEASNKAYLNLGSIDANGWPPGLYCPGSTTSILSPAPKQPPLRVRSSHPQGGASAPYENQTPRKPEL